MNTFGNLFRLTTFGESHGSYIGGVIDGCPAGLKLDLNFIKKELDRRRPGQSKITTSRVEKDDVNFISGINQGKTTGASIAFLIANNDKKSSDYSQMESSFRPSHADFTYTKKYGLRDYRGGGRSSARETANWVVAGSVAKQIIENIDITAYVSSIGAVELKYSYKDLDLAMVNQNIVRCPDNEVAKRMILNINEAKSKGDTLGGVISCVVRGVPKGWGEPIFNKLHACLGKAMLSINAVKGFEYGSGFSSTKMKGSEHNDSFLKDGVTKTNFSGGIQGGISNGMDIYFNVAFKPTSSINIIQDTINDKNENIKMSINGRHDPCVVPRAVPVVEAMTALVLTDFYLINKTSKI
mgnify:FL=1|tara:strand:- start:884 stop:1942 length:1059 start_codon:yes stop_codon:yes gene_type:complete